MKRMWGVCALILMLGPSATAAEESIWDLSAGQSRLQLAITAQIYATLEADSAAVENEYDSIARVLANLDSPAALEELTRLEFGGSRAQQAAAARALTFLAQKALLEGSWQRAADHSRHVYLSGAPHKVRMEALRVYCRAAMPEESAQMILLIETGRQDAAFRPMLSELRAARLARISDLREE